jgi:hypothetical protein
MDVVMTIQSNNTTSTLDRGTAPRNAMLELALDLWLSEMSGSTDQTAHMAARLAQLDHQPDGVEAFQPVN